MCIIVSARIACQADSRYAQVPLCLVRTNNVGSMSPANPQIHPPKPLQRQISCA